MDKSWQAWVEENIARGCDTVEMGGILLKNKFTPEQIRKMMGAHYPEALGAPAAPTWIVMLAPGVRARFEISE